MQKQNYLRLIQIRLPVSLTDAYKIDDSNKDISQSIALLDANSAEEFKEEIDLILSRLDKISPWPQDLDSLLNITEKFCFSLFLGKFGVS